jgi:hypothetical protein
MRRETYLDSVEGFSEDIDRGAHTEVHKAAMNEIERVIVHPLIINIVDFKGEVFRDEFRSNRTQVTTYDLGIGMSLGFAKVSDSLY